MADKRGIFVPADLKGKQFYVGLVNSAEDDFIMAPVGAGREAQPTGVSVGGEVNISGGTNVEIIAGQGGVIDTFTDPTGAPIPIPIEWPTTVVAIAFPISTFQVHLSMADSGVPGPTPEYFLGTLIQRDRRLTPAEMRDEIYLGYVQSNLVDTWQDISVPVVVNNNVHTLVEFINDIAGPFFIVAGGDVSENSPAFTLAISAGIIWQQNRNWHNNPKDPNREILPASDPIVYRHTTSGGEVVGAPTSVMDVANYENPLGTVTPIGGGSKNATIQRLYVDSGDNYWILWGQNIYDSFLEAVGQIGVDTEQTVIPSFLSSDSVLLGYVIAERTQTDWVDETSQFIPVTEAVAGGGGGTPAETFLDLTDTPSNYVGAAGKSTLVNPGETGLEFVEHVNETLFAPTVIVGTTYNLADSDDGKLLLHGGGFSHAIDLNAVTADNFTCMLVTSTAGFNIFDSVAPGSLFVNGVAHSLATIYSMPIYTAAVLTKIGASDWALVIGAAAAAPSGDGLVYLESQAYWVNNSLEVLSGTAFTRVPVPGAVVNHTGLDAGKTYEVRGEFQLALRIGTGNREMFAGLEYNGVDPNVVTGIPGGRMDGVQGFPYQGSAVGRISGVTSIQVVMYYTRNVGTIDPEVRHKLINSRLYEVTNP